MSWRIRVEHDSHYQYAGPVDSSYNEARITPMTTPWQMVLDARVEVEPANDPLRYLDYWGTIVHAFDLQQPHREMRIIGRSVVETAVPAISESSLSWADLRGERIRDDYAELLAPGVYVPLDPRVSAIATAIQEEHSPATAGLAAIAWAKSQLTYVAGTTGVHTSAIEAWDGGQGVCQDFAHLALAIVRPMGLPARYCSGYLHPEPDAPVGPTYAGESHAWIEVWAGDWQALDPTSGERTGERHVLVARGRDYADVSPVKGIFNGGPTALLDVTVNLTRLG